MNKIFFTHIMKTGGVSIKNFLLTNKTEETFSSHSPFDSSFLTYGQVMEVNYNDFYKDKKYFCDHKLSFVSSNYFNNKNFTIVRNPIDKFISFYNFIKTSNIECEPIEIEIFNKLVKQTAFKSIHQWYHLSEGYGIDYIFQSIKNFNCVIIPFEYINDIPKLLNIQAPIIKYNESKKFISPEDENIRKLISRHVESDMFLYDEAKIFYAKNRDNIMEYWRT